VRPLAVGDVAPVDRLDLDGLLDEPEEEFAA
jgi:hypothetical protein